MNALKIRSAQSSDSVLLYQWANDPWVRHQAIASDYIKWFYHLAWCKKRFASKNNNIWIAELNGQAIGQVRFDSSNDGSLFIDIHLDDNFRGQSLGLPLLMGAISLQIKSYNLSKMCAVIKVANGASLKIFLRAGFVVQRLQTIEGRWYWLLEKNALPLQKRIN